MEDVAEVRRAQRDVGVEFGGEGLEVGDGLPDYYAAH